MAQEQLLVATVKTLERLGIAYMLTGSHASSLQGQPRSTHDVDFVVDLTLSDLAGLLRAFPAPEFYVSEAAAREAVRSRAMFNIVESATGAKIDLWLLTDDTFDHSRFERRRVVDVFGQAIAVSTPEDTILMKLRWAMQSGSSERQVGDARHVLELNADSLDWTYLDQWAGRIGVGELLARIRD